MRRSFKFRLRPTAQQHVALDACLRDHRTLHNAALEERREAWRRGISVRYGDQSAQLKEIRQECPEQGRWSFSSQQATLRRLNRVFDSFFRRVKSGQKPGYPRFRSGNRWDSVLWPSDGDRCRWRDGRVYLQGIGAVRVSVHRPAEGAVKTLAVKREGRRWYLVLVAAKSGLNRSILDAGWAQFAAILAAKAEEAGRVMVTVNPQYTSRRCHSCGHIDAGNRNGVAFVCLACGHAGHADVNAARNVLRAGLARPAAHVA